MVQQSGWLIFATNINNYICLFPNGRVSASDNVCISEFSGVFAQKGAGEYLVTMEPAIVSTDLFLH